MNNLVGPNLGAVRTGARVGHFRPNVTAEHHSWIVKHLEAQRILLPHLEQIEEDSAIQVVFGAEVVMQIGTWQPDFLGDIAHRGAAIAFLGKNLLGSEEDFLGIAPANFDLVVGHAVSITRQ